MRIVLYANNHAACTLFLQQYSNLIDKQWNINDPLVQAHLQKSPRARNLQELPALIDIDAEGQVRIYCGTEAVVFLQQVSQLLPSLQTSSSSSAVDEKPEVVFDLDSLPQEIQSPVIPMPTNDESLLTTNTALSEALEKKRKTVTLAERAMEMRLAREAETALSGPSALQPTQSFAPSV